MDDYSCKFYMNCSWSAKLLIYFGMANTGEHEFDAEIDE